jgi:plastocyanin
MARIVLFGSAVVGLLVVTIIYAVMIGQYQDKQPESASPVPSGVQPSAAASGSAAPSASAAASASAQAEPSAQASGAGETVTITNSDFGPDLTIAAGTTVTWVNNDILPHTATNGTDGVPASDSLFNLQLPIGGSAGYTFADAGSYPVTCTIHLTMNMTITVQ